MSLSLRYYQTDAIAATEKARAEGRRRMLVVLPTGTGKTIVFANIVAKLLASGGSALILAHRDELIKQAADKLRRVAPELSMAIGIVKGKHNQTRAQIVVASVQTLARANRLRQLPTDFDLIVVDEAHHAAADSYVRILQHVQSAPVIGFTATPKRHDNRRLDDVFEEIVYARSIEQMVREGFLVPPVGKKIEAQDLDLSDVKQSRGDFTAKDLGRAMTESGATADVRQAIAKYARDRKTIVFVPTVAIASEMAMALCNDGFTARDLNGQTPEHIRAGTLDRFATDKLQVIVNVGVLTEGFDEPSVSCIVIARPTRSEGLYTQMIGRGLRLHPGKEDCLVLDLEGVSDDLSIQCLPSMFGVNEIKDGETAIAAVDREAKAKKEAAERKHAAGRQEAERRLKRRRRSHSSSDIGFFDRRQLHWLHHGDRWILGAGQDEMVVLDQQEPGSWWVLLMNSNRARPIQRNLDLNYAQGVAEDLVRNRRALGLNNKAAKWRREAPSPRQIGKLRRLGLEIPKTKGEAADKITLAIVADRLERFDRARGKTENREAVPA